MIRDKSGKVGRGLSISHGRRSPPTSPRSVNSRTALIEKDGQREREREIARAISLNLSRLPPPRHQSQIVNLSNRTIYRHYRIGLSRFVQPLIGIARSPLPSSYLSLPTLLYVRTSVKIVRVGRELLYTHRCHPSAVPPPPSFFRGR